MFRLALIGAGQRGMIYAKYAYDSGLADICAVVDPDTARRQAAAALFHIPAKRAFGGADNFFDAGKIADAVIIASMDRDHFAQTMRAMVLGYDILLEKPISPDPAECMRIRDTAEKTGSKVTVCHVLRYSPFFRQLENIVRSNELGHVISIQHNENIGNFHMAHSFVRGNWRSSRTSSPIIMQKSCHDMDLLVWLTGSRARRVSSFGSLSYFKAENAPKGSADRCVDCAVAGDCRFEARKMYLPVMGSWPATVLTQDQTEAGLLQAIKDGPYGRCVYRCDNDVCDHQVTNIEFENGITASFNLSAFTNRMGRTMKIMCEDGEIKVSEVESRIEVVRFASTGTAEELSRVVRRHGAQSGHAGGDEGLMNDFFSQLKFGETAMETRIDRSVESHFMAGAAEKSRLEHNVVDMDAYRQELKEATL